ncbi:MAG TPA: flagellar export protein FliJ [Mizugakiibacter sp.]|nr:flagellar export protein FliJ [Mizugakiibacter sp.]
MSRGDRGLVRASEMAEQKAEKALQRVASSQQVVADMEQRLIQLKQFHTDYTCTADPTTLGNMQAILNRRNFIRRIEEAIIYQRDLLEKTRHEHRCVEQAWRNERAQAKVLNRVCERHSDEARWASERTEQAMLDELSLRKPRMTE